MSKQDRDLVDEVIAKNRMGAASKLPRPTKILREERDRLRAENERLRAFLRDTVCAQEAGAQFVHDEDCPWCAERREVLGDEK